MRIIEDNDNLIVKNVRDFKLEHIFDCGQCFRWNKCNDGYIGVAYGKALKIAQNGDTLTLFGTSKEDWNRVWCDYFDMHRDYGRIKSALSSDEIMESAVNFGSGIRILNQDPFECLISFIISASNNIPRIKKIIDSLCTNFGEEIHYMGNIYHSFPSPERLSQLSAEDISVIRAGFRDKYILNSAKAVSSGIIDLECLKKSSFEYAKRELLKLNGVGSKVAECVLLFSLGKSDSFPVDVWIKRIVEHCYFSEEQTKEAISAFAKEKFGALGGFAQQYLFFWARENKIGI
ncbi:MAG: DNA glycosylase [Firmicutes bacterium]|nr:DNA glycosylase [Bacillota bacterium]